MSPNEVITPAPARATSATPAVFRGAVVAPLFVHDPAWPWLTGVPPLDACPFSFFRIRNRLARASFATGLYRRWQHRRAARGIADADVAFLFSVDVALAVSRHARRCGGPKIAYVGFTQDGHWSAPRVRAVGAGLRRCDAVTVFTEAERSIYLERYGVEPAAVHVVPIHTDDTTGYRRCAGTPPHPTPYALALGVTNRRFTPTALACRALGIPLVVLTRATHRHDDLDELARLGATVHTDADQDLAWRYLRSARLAIMQFADPGLPGGFTTVINAMLLGTPLVVGDSVGMDEHVVDGATGFVTRRGDDRGLRDAIARLWEDDALARSFAAAGLSRAEARHSLAAAAPRFHELALEAMSR